MPIVFCPECRTYVEGGKKWCLNCNKLLDESSADKNEPLAQAVKSTAQTEHMSDVLHRHLGSVIAINMHAPAKLEPVWLVSVSADHFSVFDSRSRLLFRYPLTRVSTVIEAPSGFLKLEPNDKLSYGLAVVIDQPMVPASGAASGWLVGMIAH